MVPLLPTADDIHRKEAKETSLHISYKELRFFRFDLYPVTFHFEGAFICEIDLHHINLNSLL